MTWVPLYRPARRFRKNWQRPLSPSYRATQGGTSRVAMIRLVVLLGIFAALVVKEGVGLDLKLTNPHGLPDVGAGEFTLV
jgi:hypothetical protein